MNDKSGLRFFVLALEPGMHGAAFFASGQKENFSGCCGAGEGVNSSGRGRLTVKLGAFLGRGSLENFREEAANFPGPGRGRGVHP